MLNLIEERERVILLQHFTLLIQKVKKGGRFLFTNRIFLLPQKYVFLTLLERRQAYLSNWKKMVSHFEFLYFWTYRITYLSTANLSVKKKLQFPDCPVKYRSISVVIGMYDPIMLIFSKLNEFRNYGGSVVCIKFEIKIWSRDQLHFVAV